jgi:CubicO group peptidase (beta-lactamase class C family)
MADAFPLLPGLGVARQNRGASLEAGGSLMFRTPAVSRWLSCIGALALLLTSCSVAPGPAPSVAAQPATRPAARPGKPEDVGMSSARLAQLRADLQKLVDEGRFAGYVITAARHGQVVLFEAIGNADIVGPRPMQKDSIFQIASMTKPITGVAMMILYEEGKWQLDDPVAKYIPEFAQLKVQREDGSLEPVAQPMTMRQLMSHSAGFAYGLAPSSPVDRMYRDKAVLGNDHDLQGMIDRLAALPLAYQPGTRWQYSVSVDVQGYLVEKLSGQRFDEFLRARVFTPLGMKDTDFAVAPEARGRAAVIHGQGPGGKLQSATGTPFERDPTVRPKLLSGGGGLASTAEDYRRFCQMLLNRGELDGVRILKPETVEMMYSDQLPAGVAMGGQASALDPSMRFGLDFAVMTNPAAPARYGKNTYFWGGAFGTWFWIDPTNDLLFVGMVQTFGGPGSGVSGAGSLRTLSAAATYEALVDPAK